ncbi:MAG: NAD-dependent epimerase [Acidobacteria bacterium]|jgi:UDP-glucose 4-epimerase|nr:NAD-dependent epimerase [Acidobacteriota bacterium]|tara:strand:+ start:4724 stop:5635 length:912 start_codon:yes stop_codon:yes gene_type:complete
MSEQAGALRAVVIGGSGFLGSHVADQLSDNGHSVCIYDQEESPWRRHNQEMVMAELSDESSLAEAISGSDVVYNFAALADLDEAASRPKETAETNILGNIKVLECCCRNDVGRFVFASTVYVNSREGGFYRCSKQAAEEYIEEYQRAFDLDFTILRYGSLYGPRAPDSNSLRMILGQAMRDGAIRYAGSPDAIREYIHVEDAARASVSILGESYKNRTIVVTGLESIRMSDLLAMCAEILELPQNIEYLEDDQTGHYIRTPYAYRNNLARKYIPSLTIDLGQGVLQLLDELSVDPSRPGSVSD